MTGKPVPGDVCTIARRQWLRYKWGACEDYCQSWSYSSLDSSRTGLFGYTLLSVSPWFIRATGWESVCSCSRPGSGIYPFSRATKYFSLGERVVWTGLFFCCWTWTPLFFAVILLARPGIYFVLLATFFLSLLPPPFPSSLFRFPFYSPFLPPSFSV